MVRSSLVRSFPQPLWSSGGGDGERKGRGGGGGHMGRFRRDPLSVFSAEGRRGQFRHGQGRPLFNFIHPAFPQPPVASSTIQVALRMVLERLSCRMTCPNHASLYLLRIARRGSRGSARKLILLLTQSLVLCSEQETRSFFTLLIWKAWIIF